MSDEQAFEELCAGRYNLEKRNGIYLDISARERWYGFQAALAYRDSQLVSGILDFEDWWADYYEAGLDGSVAGDAWHASEKRVLSKIASNEMLKRVANAIASTNHVRGAEPFSAEQAMDKAIAVLKAIMEGVK